MEEHWVALLITLQIWGHLIPRTETTFPSQNISCEYNAMTDFLHDLAAKYNSTSRLISIGQTEEDREIWTMIVSDSPDNRPLLRPQVKFVGNVNGMSGPACYVLLRLTKHLLEEYQNEASMERKLMDSMEIHIIPNLNPDGYAKAVPGSCYGKSGRRNANNVNLNTNFPGIWMETTAPPEKETMAMMSWMRENRFTISVSLISGAQVAVYPFDSIPENEMAAMPDSRYHPTPDDDIFKSLALLYAERTRTPEMGWHCPDLQRSFPRGIINGAEWKPQSGTMMDYNYIHGTFEIMVGISCCRNENNQTVLNELWWKNRESLLHVIHEVEGGIRGQVIDAETYEAIGGASLSKRHVHSGEGDEFSIPWYTTENGEFWRPWRPGTYKLIVEKEGYITQEIDVKVQKKQATFILVRLPQVVLTTTTPHYVMQNDYPKNVSTVQPDAAVSEATENTEDPDAEEKSLKHYSSLTQLDHSFINLLRGIQFSGSATISKNFYYLHVIILVLINVLFL